MSVLPILFGKKQLDRKVKEAWSGYTWSGVEVSSETIRDKNAPRMLAEKIRETAKTIKAPVVIGLQEMMCLIPDRMWLGGIRVMWPDNTDGVTLIPLFRNLYGWGRVYVTQRSYSNFDEVLEWAKWGDKASNFQRINFNLKPDKLLTTGASSQ